MNKFAYIALNSSSDIQFRSHRLPCHFLICYGMLPFVCERCVRSFSTKRDLGGPLNISMNIEKGLNASFATKVFHIRYLTQTHKIDAHFKE